tara:strand:+ start:37 stop:705 length:669 start_codon:yes stop_codon:yes gene_type:complete
MFDFSWSSLMDMLPDSLNPMNLLPESLNPFKLGQGLLEDGAASLAPKIRDSVRQQMMNQVKGVVPSQLASGVSVPSWVSGAPTTGQYMNGPSGALQQITPEMSKIGMKPALNQGIFAPNEPVVSPGGGGFGEGMLDGNVPINSDTSTEETEEEKKEREEREARTKELLSMLSEQSKTQTTQPVSFPTASAGSGGKALAQSVPGMSTVESSDNRKRTFGILGV